jgi:hypothetical protein
MPIKRRHYISKAQTKVEYQTSFRESYNNPFDTLVNRKRQIMRADLQELENPTLIGILSVTQMRKKRFLTLNMIRIVTIELYSC